MYSVFCMYPLAADTGAEWIYWAFILCVSSTSTKQHIKTLNCKAFFPRMQWFSIDHKTYLLLYTLTRGITTMIRVFANGPWHLCSVLGWVIPKTQKWYLRPSCLTLSNIRQGSRVKWNSPGKGDPPKPWCCSYWKGSIRVTLDYDSMLKPPTMLNIF